MAGGFRIGVMAWSRVLQRYAFFVMQTYLTKVWGLSFTHAAGILNIWEGLQMTLPLFLHFVVDDYIGNFNMLVISGISNTLGMTFISMSTPPVLANLSGTCKEYKSECIGHPQKVLFYVGMALVALALAGYNVSLSDFIREQKGLRRNSSFDLTSILPYGLMTPVLVVTPRILAVTLPEGKLWWVRFAVPTIFSAIAMFLFLSGRGTYMKKERQKSPVTTLLRVFTASALNISQPFPEDAAKLYMSDETSTTPYLRFLEKAAIDVSPHLQSKSKWKRCSVKEVEEAKVVVRMIPIWSTFVIYGIVSSIGNTYFVEQLNNLNRRIGKWNVPLPVFLLYIDCSMNMGRKQYAFLIKIVHYLGTSNKGPISGISFAMICSVLCCITSACIERRRLNVVRSHGLLDKPDDYIPMTAYWMLFQISLLVYGSVDVLKESASALSERNAPDESMASYLNYITEGVFGLSYMAGALSVHVVGRISELGGKPNWFQFTLNRSRLDHYYWVLAALSAVNLVIFIVMACFFGSPPLRKNADKKETVEAQEAGGDSTNIKTTVEGSTSAGSEEELAEKKNSMVSATSTRERDSKSGRDSTTRERDSKSAGGDSANIKTTVEGSTSAGSEEELAEKKNSMVSATTTRERDSKSGEHEFPTDSETSSQKQHVIV